MPTPDLTESITTAAAVVSGAGPLYAVMLLVIIGLVLGYIPMGLVIRALWNRNNTLVDTNNVDGRAHARDFMDVAVKTNSVLEKVTNQNEAFIDMIAKAKG